MRVHDDAGGDAERVTQHDVRRLSRDAGKLKQFFHRLRHASAVPLADHLARALNRLRLVSEEACRVYVALKLGGGRGRVVLPRTVFSEEVCGDEVDALVRALRGEYRRDEEFERARVVEAATRVRVLLLERRDDAAHALLLLGGRFQVSPQELTTETQRGGVLNFKLKFQIFKISAPLCLRGEFQTRGSAPARALARRLAEGLLGSLRPLLVD